MMPAIVTSKSTYALMLISLVLSLWSTNGSTQSLESVKSQLQDRAINLGEQLINTQTNNWLNNIGQGRTQLILEGIEQEKPNYRLETIQPLSGINPGIEQLLFFQGSVLSADNQGERRPTLNLGLGQRYLIDDAQAVAGVNLFLDYEAKSKHKRASLGLEYQRSNFSLGANYYQALSDKKVIGQYTEEPLSGYDVNLLGQVPYTSWAKIRAQHYFWDQKVGDDIKGSVLGIEVKLSPSSSIEFGQEDNNTQNKQNYAKLSLKLPFKQSEKPSNFSLNERAFNNGAIMDLTELEFVKRQQMIRVEKRLNIGANTSNVSGNTTELGGTASFTLALNTQPSADVVIAISSDDTTEGVVSPASLTFTTSNWNVAQSISVTGVDDNIHDGDISYNIVTAPAVSADANYSGLNLADIALSNIDDDLPDVVVNFDDKTYITVVSPDTLRVWLDRNLGANQVCSASTDANCYGDLYQWGRNDDGHESRTSNTTSTLASDISPGHANFIQNSVSPHNWSTADSSGSARVSAWADEQSNDICPAGYEVPTEAEFKADTTTASTTTISNLSTAYSSFLKLPAAGYRGYAGVLTYVDTYGSYWVRSPGTTNYGRGLDISAASAVFRNPYASQGQSIRCIKN